VDASGRLTAAQAYLAYESGAFPGGWAGPGAMCVFACYDIPNALIDGYDVCVNKPTTAAYRAPGATNAAFASESVAAKICEQPKIDPLDFRMKNGAHEGTRRADGPVFARIGIIETVETAKKHSHYTASPEDKVEKKGKKSANGVATRSLPRGRGV